MFAEPVNTVSHLGGAAVFLALTWPLLRRGRGGGGFRVVSLAMFAMAGVVLLALSGVYHLLPAESESRSVLRRLDHAAIFVMIAATFTPIHAILFCGVWRWGMLLFIWSAAATGITLKSVFFEGIPAWLGVLIYVAFGWLGLISAYKLWRGYGLRFILPLLYGAVAYTLGAGCLGLLALLGGPMIIPGLVGRHELFHFAVLAGLGCHWWFVWSFADRPRIYPNCEAASSMATKCRAKKWGKEESGNKI